MILESFGHNFHKKVSYTMQHNNLSAIHVPFLESVYIYTICMLALE